MAKTDFKSVDEYIATHPADVQGHSLAPWAACVESSPIDPRRTAFSRQGQAPS